MPTEGEKSTAEHLLIDLAAIPTEHGLCTCKPVVGGYDCPFDRQCNSCEHFVLTGADSVVLLADPDVLADVEPVSI